MLPDVATFLQRLTRRLAGRQAMPSVGVILATLALLGQLLLPALPHKMAMGDSARQSVEQFWASRGVQFIVCDQDNSEPAQKGPLRRSVDCPVCQAIAQSVSVPAADSAAIVPPTRLSPAIFTPDIDQHRLFRAATTAQARAPPTSV